MLVFLMAYLMFGVNSISTKKCSITENRRLSLCAYTGNAFIGRKVETECSSDVGNCKAAFDGSSSPSKVWIPTDNSPSILGTITRILFMGKILCNNSSCDCFLNRKVAIAAENNTQEAYIIKDPFDVRGQGWLRFDFSLMNVTEKVNITFPSSNSQCSPQFIEIELYSTGSMTHQKETRRTNYGTNMNLDILPLVNPAYNRDVIFIRITVKAAYHVTKPTTIIMNITRQYGETLLRTFYVGKLFKEESSQSFIQMLERENSFQFTGSLVVHEEFIVTIEYFLISKFSIELTQALEHNVTCNSTTVSTVTDNNITSFWTGSKSDNLIFSFNDTIQVKQFLILQKNIATFKLIFSETDCLQVHSREKHPQNGTRWITVQIAIKTPTHSLTLSIDDVHDQNEEAVIKEIKLYKEVSGYPIGWRTTAMSTTTSTTTTTNTTSPSITTTTNNMTIPPTTASTTTASTTTATTTTGIILTTKQDTTVDSVNKVTTGVTVPTTVPTTTVTNITTTTSTTSTTMPHKEKLTYTVTMKLLGVTFQQEMADNASSIYKQTNNKYVPMVKKAIRKTVKDRYLPPVYNIWYKAGSVDMTYSFDVAGTEEIGITSLKDNLLDIFSASGINLDPSMNIDDNKPSMAQGDEKLLLIGLVGALTSLAVVIAMAITIVCIRRRCANSLCHADNKTDSRSDSTLAQYSINTMTSPHSRIDRVWQRSESMTDPTWYDNMLHHSQQVLAHRRQMTSSAPIYTDHFMYPEEPSSLRERYYSVPDHVESLDYFTDTICTFSRPPLRFRTEPSGASHDDPSLTNIEMDDVTQDHYQDLDAQLSNHQLVASGLNDGEHSFSRQESTSTDVTSCKLPKFYREQDAQATYRGFFETLTDNMAGTSIATDGDTRHTGLRRTRPESDVLHPSRLPFKRRISVNDGDSDISPDAASNESDILDKGQYDSGYDEALRLYYTDPKLDDRNILEKISESFGRNMKPDMLHREPPPYLKSESRRHKSKSKRESRA